jgi:hypothetical protein
MKIELQPSYEWTYCLLWSTVSPRDIKGSYLEINWTVSKIISTRISTREARYRSVGSAFGSTFWIVLLAWSNYCYHGLLLSRSTSTIPSFVGVVFSRSWMFDSRGCPTMTQKQHWLHHILLITSWWVFSWGVQEVVIGHHTINPIGSVTW